MQKPQVSFAKVMSNFNTHIEETKIPLAIHTDAIIPTLPDGDLWVFGYGSLMWRTGFEFTEAVEARIFGYHRALCVSSVVHRGTPQQAGLVLGLDRGGSCTGKLFRVSNNLKEEVTQYLYARELATNVYFARVVKAHAVDGRCIQALTFVVDTKHHQYTTGKSPHQLVDIVRTASGISGKSSDYLLSTLEHLRQSKIHDAKLESIAALL